MKRVVEGIVPPWITGVEVEVNVAEPPELSRLKRTSNGIILGLSGNVPIQPPVLGSNKHTPREGESRDITTTILQQAK